LALYISSREQLAELLLEIDWNEVEICDGNEDSTTFKWRDGIYIIPESVCGAVEILVHLHDIRQENPSAPNVHEENRNEGEGRIYSESGNG
jgi:hypothetical protein